MIIYHGSEKIIKRPVYGKGNLHNDYGRGFYCTECIQLAKEWACEPTHGGYSNAYELREEGLSVLDLSDKDYSILHWITLLISNRVFEIKSEISQLGYQYLTEHFSIDVSAFDIIKGYRADDSYFAFAQDFLDNTITVNKLHEAMRLGKLGEQIVLISKKAIDCISFVGAEEAPREVYFPMRKARDDMARRSYFDIRGKLSLTIKDIFLADIIREGIISGDSRIP